MESPYARVERCEPDETIVAEGTVVDEPAPGNKLLWKLLARISEVIQQVL